MYRSEEDYLKGMYELSIEQGKTQIKTAELARFLGYSDQSINEKIKKLVAKDYVLFEPYIGISLTEKGETEAIRMVRAHRIWEVFLMQKLGYTWAELHTDAEELEHASSKKVIENLYNYLGKPEYCTHGNPIPDDKGLMAPIALKRLSDANAGDKFIVNRVLDQKELLLYLNELGISLNDVLHIQDKNEYAEIITVYHNEKELVLTYPIAERMFTF